jgi:hypothetical protein
MNHFVLDDPGHLQQSRIDRYAAFVIRLGSGKVQAMELRSKHDTH